VNDDWLEALATLLDSGARFLVVGAHAMAVHGVPRATQDLDIWIEPSEANARLVWQGLAEFGAPLESLNVTLADFTTPDRVIQIGLPPNRIDILTSITGVPNFEDAWNERLTTAIAGRDVPFIGRGALERNKRAAARPRDIADLDALSPGP
jgi:hypothetical protein